MPQGIDEMIDDALWNLRHGVWFSGPYRAAPTAEGRWDLWYYDRTSTCLKRGLLSLAEAKRAAEAHREVRRAT